MKTKKNISNAKRIEKGGGKSGFALTYGKGNDIPLKDGQKNDKTFGCLYKLQA